MVMKKIKLLTSLFIAALFILPACKTTEANYRSAYDKAVAGRDNSTALDSTIYGAHRRNIGSRIALSAAGDTVEVRRQRVAMTKDGGATEEPRNRYYVVVGQFKQSFNAKSMRRRIVDAGFNGTFVVQNGEPYYYVVLSAHKTEAEAIEAAVSIPKNFPMPLRSPLPYILYNP